MDKKQINNIFISYCSDDEMIIQNLEECLYEIMPNYKFFNTHNERNSTIAGKAVSSELRSALSNADVMIAIVSDSYIRSPICLAEISSFWYLNRPILPLIFGKRANTAKFVADMFGTGFIYIDMTDEKVKVDKEKTVENASEKTFNTLKNFGFHFLNQDNYCINKLCEFFSNAKCGKVIRPYIGSNDVFFNNISMFNPEYGIKYILDKPLNISQSVVELQKMNNIYIVATTGFSLIHILTDSADNILARMLSTGSTVTILISNLYSDFVNDVARIENRSVQSFADQYRIVIENLKFALKKSKEINPQNNGKLFIGSTHNLLRQTVVLGEKDNDVYGWISLTLPPNRTANKTLQVGFSGNIKDEGLPQLAYNHVTGIKEFSNNNSSLYELTENTNLENGFYLEKESAKQYWNGLYNDAIQNMSLLDDDETELIEVAANHPLKLGEKPSKEFKSRLEYAANLYLKMTESGKHVKIYVPGSRHRYGNKNDKISLSQAGKEYLLKKSIPEKDILGEYENFRYKKEKGVYNSADECYVASMIFKNGNYSKLHCVCSSNQLMRKKFFYIAFGVLPLYHSVDTQNLTHNEIYEIFEGIPNVIYNDHTWQEEDSPNGIRTRKERIPTD